MNNEDTKARLLARRKLDEAQARFLAKSENRAVLTELGEETAGARRDEQEGRK